jgi:hypothetical protein
MPLTLVLGQGGVRGGVTLLVVLGGGTGAQYQQRHTQDLQMKSIGTLAVQLNKKKTVE